MSLIEARSRKAPAFRLRFSQSLASLRHLLSQASVRSPPIAWALTLDERRSARQRGTRMTRPPGGAKAFRQIAAALNGRGIRRGAGSGKTVANVLRSDGSRAAQTIWPEPRGPAG